MKLEYWVYTFFFDKFGQKASINHPNIISFKECFIEEQYNELYLITEYCENGDLQEKINKLSLKNSFMEETII